MDIVGIDSVTAYEDMVSPTICSKSVQTTSTLSVVTPCKQKLRNLIGKKKKGNSQSYVQMKQNKIKTFSISKKLQNFKKQKSF